LQQKEVLEKGNRIINYSTQMKKLFSFIAFAMMAVFSLSLASCGNSDDDDVVEASIVGTWEVTYVKASSSYPMEDVGDGLKIGDRMTFHSDGTYEDSIDIGRWSLNGNTLTVVVDDDMSLPAIMKIKKLTDKVLEVELDYGSFIQFEIKMKRVS